MFKANVGSSIAPEAKKAGIEAGLAAKNGLDAVKMAFVYGSCEYDVDQMIAGVKESMPGVPLIGNTSFTGIITPEGFVGSDGGFVGVMAFSDENMKVGIAASERGKSPIETGKAVALEAMKKAGKDTTPAFFDMAASPAEEDFYLKGFSSVICRVPLFG